MVHVSLLDFGDKTQFCGRGSCARDPFGYKPTCQEEMFLNNVWTWSL